MFTLAARPAGSGKPNREFPRRHHCLWRPGKRGEGAPGWRRSKVFRQSWRCQGRNGRMGSSRHVDERFPGMRREADWQRIALAYDARPSAFAARFGRPGSETRPGGATASGAADAMGGAAIARAARRLPGSNGGAGTAGVRSAVGRPVVRGREPARNEIDIDALLSLASFVAQRDRPFGLTLRPIAGSGSDTESPNFVSHR